MAADDFLKANAAYDRWLRKQLRGKVVAADLAEKWKKIFSQRSPLRTKFKRIWALDISKASARITAR
jgi:hypothetical protein